MKEVYILRHANWDGKEDALTIEGAEAAEEKSKTLPQFDITYSSPFNRTQQTAKILSKGADLKIESSASVPQSPLEVREQILARRNTHPLGIAGALFEEHKAHPALRTAGEALVHLIQFVLNELQENQRVLIVSHDGTMVAAERILTHIDFTKPLEHTYNELEGFTVNEKLEISGHI